MGKFKIGDKVKVVGKKDGCRYHRCFECPTFKGKELIIKEVNCDTGVDTNTRTVSAETLDKTTGCSFNPADLEFTKVNNWREKIEDVY